MDSAGANASVRVEPVFFKNSDVPQTNNKWLNTWEICTACSSIVKKEHVEAAQRIGDLWRIYLLDETARVTLLSQGINLRGQQVELKDRNPFLTIGYENVDTTRLFIRNIPLSFDNAEIEDAVKNLGVEMINQMKYSRARDPDGKLTNFKTGDRFVDMVVPDVPLPKKLPIGIFTASLYHKEQKTARGDIECGNCMMKGHIRKDCPNEIVCYDCKTSGHKKGDPECPLFKNESPEDEDDEPFTDAAENTDRDENSESESDEDARSESHERNVSEMLKDALATAGEKKQPKGKKHKEAAATPKTEKQKLITGFVSSSIHNDQPASRPGSPAGRRKMDDRSPEDPKQKQTDKKTKKNKNK